VAKAAKDWPQLNFIIYHGGYRSRRRQGRGRLEPVETTGRIEWSPTFRNSGETTVLTNCLTPMSASCSASNWFQRPRLAAAGESIAAVIDDELSCGQSLAAFATSPTAEYSSRLGNCFSIDGGKSPLWMQTFWIRLLDFAYADTRAFRHPTATDASKVLVGVVADRVALHRIG